MIDINARVIYSLTAWLPTSEKENQIYPLTAREWSDVAQKIYKADIKPKDIRSKSQDEITRILDLEPKLSERIVKLLNRSGQVVFELEKYRTRGYELLTRADTDYPKKLKETMLKEMPPFFWYVGDIKILINSFLSVQFSSNTDNSSITVIRDGIFDIKKNKYSIILSFNDDYSIQVAQEAINNDIQVLGIIPFGLLKLTKQPVIRDLLESKKLLLLSQSYPSIIKYYKYNGKLQKKVELALADKTLILPSGKLNEILKDEIEKINYDKIYVYNSGDNLKSNKKLSEYNNIINIPQIFSSGISDSPTEPVEDNENNNCIYTIGHSNHTMEKFIELLKENNIELVVEVRSNAKSSYLPHFNKQSLIYNLNKHGIKYLDKGKSLGGRPEDTSVLNKDNKILEDIIEEKPWYQDGINILINFSKDTRLALMCSEENPLNCHRGYVISHTLMKNGINIEHIRGSGKNDKGKRFVKNELHQGNFFED
jgi:hypothetical protein